MTKRNQTFPDFNTASPLGEGFATGNNIYPIPTPYNRRQNRLRRLFSRLTIMNVFVIFALLAALGGLYAWKVAVMSRLETQTQVAKNLYEENMQLEVELNQLRSFENINEKISKAPNLVAAKEKIQIQSTLEDWNQPILLGEQKVLRPAKYQPFAGL
jgi:cell division protein FtsB